ncbi:MAG: hypothetical protein LAO31_06075 [Acidobacteriia bacterium]|nr:hypothetical protein [Terriglobia bacterium]
MKSSLAKLVGYSCLAFTLTAGCSSAEETFVTTIKLFPSPKEILSTLGATAHWRAQGSAVGTDNLGSIENGPSISPVLLKECGIRSFWQGSYERGPRSVSVQIFEMGDSSGAYSLYTIQVQPGGHPETTGDQASSTDNDLWLWQANLVVHIQDQKSSGKANAQLLEIARAVSTLIRQHAELPNLVKRLPFHNQVSGSSRYAVGPQGFSNLKIPLETSKLGLEMGAEVSMAKYQFPTTEGQLLLLSYPTPQLARKFYTNMKDAHSLLLNPSPTSTIVSKRSGPLIAVLFGTLSEAEAKTLLQAIQYTANLTWDEMPPGVEMAAYLLRVKQSIMLTGALLLITFGVGVVFGLIRVAAKRWLPISIFDRPEVVELTQLRLWERSAPPPTGPPSK